MDDTISRAAVLEIIRGYCPDEPKSKDLREYWKKRFEPLIKVREEVEKMPLSDGWIPCKERMPKVREWVLCQCRAGIMDVLRLTEDGSWNKSYPHTEYMSGFVIAWMPLPESWEGEENGTPRGV